MNAPVPQSDSNRSLHVIKCPSCGYRNPPGNAYCGKCGHKLSSEGEDKSQAASPTTLPSEKPAVAQGPQAVSVETRPPAVSQPPVKVPSPKNPKKKTLLLIGAAGLLAVCLCIAVVVVVPRLLPVLGGSKIAQSQQKPPHTGAFLLENGQFVEITKQQGKADLKDPSKVPATLDKRPKMILWDTQADLSNLVLSAGAGGKVKISITPQPDGIYEITPADDLDDGSYCLVMGGANVPYLLMPHWCFYEGERAVEPTAQQTTSPESLFHLLLLDTKFRTEATGQKWVTLYLGVKSLDREWHTIMIDAYCHDDVPYPALYTVEGYEYHKDAWSSRCSSNYTSLPPGAIFRGTPSTASDDFPDGIAPVATIDFLIGEKVTPKELDLTVRLDGNPVLVKLDLTHPYTGPFAIDDTSPIEYKTPGFDLEPGSLGSVRIDGMQAPAPIDASSPTIYSVTVKNNSLGYLLNVSSVEAVAFDENGVRQEVSYDNFQAQVDGISPGGEATFQMALKKDKPGKYWIYGKVESIQYGATNQEEHQYYYIVITR